MMLERLLLGSWSSEPFAADLFVCAQCTQGAAMYLTSTDACAQEHENKAIQLVHFTRCTVYRWLWSQNQPVQDMLLHMSRDALRVFPEPYRPLRLA